MAYATLAEVRATDGLSDTTTFPDALLNEAIAWAEVRIDQYTGTSWEYRPFSVALDGSGSRTIRLETDDGRPVLYPRSIASASLNGTALATSGWTFYSSGILMAPVGVVLYVPTGAGANVLIAGMAGATTAPPADIAWAARTLARQYALDFVTRVPDRAIQIQNDYGTVQLAQASGSPDRPTSLPEVNAVLIRRRQWSDAI